LAAGVQSRPSPTSVKWYTATWEQCSSSLDHQNGTQQPGNGVRVVLTIKGIQWQRFVTEGGVKAFLPRECFTSPPLPRGSHPLNSFRHGTCCMQHEARWIRSCCLSNVFRKSV